MVPRWGFVAGSAIEHIAYDGFNMPIRGCSGGNRQPPAQYPGLFGPVLPGEKYYNSGNAGMADLVAALKWINANIEAFGEIRIT